MSTQVQPRLIGVGIALVLVGILALGFTAVDRMRAADDTRVTAPASDAIPADRATPSHLTLLWPIAGGLCLAVGAALIGIGMNRWTRQGQQAIQDAETWPSTEKPHRNA
jgi:hypothetical protein